MRGSIECIGKLIVPALIAGLIGFVGWAGLTIARMDASTSVIAERFAIHSRRLDYLEENDKRQDIEIFNAVKRYGHQDQAGRYPRSHALPD